MIHWWASGLISYLNHYKLSCNKHMYTNNSPVSWFHYIWVKSEGWDDWVILYLFLILWGIAKMSSMMVVLVNIPIYLSDRQIQVRNLFLDFIGKLSTNNLGVPLRKLLASEKNFWQGNTHHSSPGDWVSHKEGNR